MRLLVITQKIDRADPVLGFFHRWVEEFSKRLKTVVVVCLQKGDYDLPGNVAVLSLGKEKWKSTLKYVFLLFYFSIRYFNRYDAVLVHMNQEYILAAGWLWKLLGKKIYMWRNHYSGSVLTDISSVFCTKIFCTSHYSYTARFKKTHFMPVGIDTDIFKPDASVQRIPRTVLSLGRISPSKNIHVLIDALKILHEKKMDFVADIYGDATPGAEVYAESLRKSVGEAGLTSRIRFFPGIPNTQTPKVYSAHHVFVNLSPNGMYDKTIFEGMACGCIVFASNDDLRAKIDDTFMFPYGDASALAAKISAFLAMPETEQKKVAANISTMVRDNSLSKLTEDLIGEIIGKGN
jgi:glycosyltransferase involved in cell wall biosynthesis